MIKQTLTKTELDSMVSTMAELDYGREIMIDIVEEVESDNDLDSLEFEYDEWEEVESDDGHRELYEDEYTDGQPDEYTEWQDYMGGDDWDHGQYDH